MHSRRRGEISARLAKKNYICTDMKHYISLLVVALLAVAGCRPKPQPVQQVETHQPLMRTMGETHYMPAISQEDAQKAEQEGYKDGYLGGTLGVGRGYRTSHHEEYLDQDLRRIYLDAYKRGVEAGYVIYYQRQDSIREAEARKEAELPRGYRDGYEDGYEDGADGDYKSSWNPRSKSKKYLKDYTLGYHEGYESGCEDMWEDYEVEGSFDAFDEW